MMDSQFNGSEGSQGSSVLGHVQRVASSSRSPAPAIDDHIVSADSSHSTRTSTRPSEPIQEREGQLDNSFPTDIDLARYEQKLAGHAKDVWKHFNRPSRRYLFRRGDTLQPRRGDWTDGALSADPVTSSASSLAPPGWTLCEKAAFFNALSRHSRLRPDLISSDLHGSKTTAQVAHFISLLSRASRKLHTSRRNRRRLIGWFPAAKEVSDHWVALEAEAAGRLGDWDRAHHQRIVTPSISVPPSLYSGRSPPVSWDTQVQTAMLFLDDQLKNNRHLGTSANIRLHRGTEAPTVSTVVFSFGTLLSLLVLSAAGQHGSRRAGDARKDYLRFSETHPVPTLVRLNRSAGGNPSIHRQEVGRGSEGHETHLPKEGNADQESAHGGTVYRLLLRAIELNYLIRVTKKSEASFNTPSDSVPHHTLRLSKHGTGIRQLRHRYINSDTPAPLPHRLLRRTELIWADSLPIDGLPENRAKGLVEQIRKVNVHMKRARRSALDRVLASVTLEEGRWIASLLDSGVPNDDPLHESPQGHTSREERRQPGSIAGIFLPGLSAKERNRIRMRIKRYETKFGKIPLGVTSAAISLAQAPPVDRQLNLNTSPIRHRPGILDPFHHIIDALPPEERPTARSRLRSRIVRWGLEATLAVGFEAWSEAPNVRQRSRSVRSPTQLSEVGNAQSEVGTKVDAGKQDVPPRLPNERIQSSPGIEPGTGLIDNSTNSNLATIVIPNGSDVIDRKEWRARRFGEAGVTRQEIVDRLSELVGGDSILKTVNFRTLFAHMKIMGERTRCQPGDVQMDEERLEGEANETATRLDLLNLLPIITTKLRTFISSIAMEAARRCKEHDSSTVSAFDIHEILHERDERFSLGDLRAGEYPHDDHSAPLKRNGQQRRVALSNLSMDPPIDWGSCVNADDLFCPDQDMLPSKRNPSLCYGEVDNLADEDDDDEDEMFESHYEAVQVEMVRSIWCGRSSQRYLGKNDGKRGQREVGEPETMSAMFRSFYWPKREENSDGGTSEDEDEEEEGSTEDLEQIPDEEHRDPDQERPRSTSASLPSDHWASDDSEAESEAWWESLAQEDEKSDQRGLSTVGVEGGVEKNEWVEWFGGKVPLSGLLLPPRLDEEIQGDGDGDGDEDEDEEQEREQEQEQEQERRDQDHDGNEHPLEEVLGEEAGGEDAEDVIPDWLKEVMASKKSEKDVVEVDSGDSEGESSGASQEYENEDRDTPGGAHVEESDEPQDVEMADVEEVQDESSFRGQR